MKIQTLIVGELATNCFIVSDTTTNKCIIIDPGDGAELISEQIMIQNLEPVAIIATHGHFDHVLAAHELQLAFEIPFMIHQGDKKLLKIMKKSAEYWLRRKLIEIPPKIDEALEDGKEVEFGKSKLTALHAPGHSPGGICLYNDDEKIVFTGDTLFAVGVGRTDFPYGSSDELTKSLTDIQKKFKGYKGYAGHYEEFVV